jgi:hypothetical protein
LIDEVDDSSDEAFVSIDDDDDMTLSMILVKVIT